MIGQPATPVADSRTGAASASCFTGRDDVNVNIMGRLFRPGMTSGLFFGRELGDEAS